MNGFSTLSGVGRRVCVVLMGTCFVSGALAQTPPTTAAGAPPAPTSAAPNPSPSDQALADLQKQARALEVEAAAQAKAGQLARAQLLYGQAAVLYHREARLARQEALTMTAAGDAAAAASRHEMALAADNNFLHSMASEVALIKKQTLLSAHAPKIAKAIKTKVPRKVAVVKLPPVPAPVAQPVLPVPPPVNVVVKRVPVAAAHPRKALPAIVMQSPVLLALRYQAVFHLLQAVRFASQPHQAKPQIAKKPRLAKRLLPLPVQPILPTPVELTPTPQALPPPPPIAPATPPTADFRSALWSPSPWTGVQEVLVDRTFESGAPTLLQISGSWAFRPDGTWEREIRTANGIVFPAHGTYTVVGNTLLLVTHLDAGGTETTRYHYGASGTLSALSLVTSTPNGYERYLLYAHGTEAQLRSQQALDDLAPSP